MAGVSKRIFGDIMPLNISEKLKNRQLYARSSNPNEPIITDKGGTYKSNFNGAADLSSRIPFARMWVAVQVIEGKPVNDSQTQYDKRQDAADAISEDDITKRGIYIKKTDSKKYEHYKSEAIASKIYSLGNNILNTVSTGVNTSRKNANGSAFDAIIPSEFETNSNQFLKPPAGITSVTSETEKNGLIKKTTVNFSVHNFHDFDTIYSRYFLRPGAQIFVDFGWDTSKIYNPEEIINKKSSKQLNEYLQDEMIKDANGDAETIMGLVIDYSAKIDENGSFKCSVTLMSKNIALLSSDIDEDQKRYIKTTLDISILQYLVNTVGGEAGKKATKRTFSKEEAEDFKEAAEEFANLALKSRSRGVPSELATITGIYYTEERDEKALFVSYGWFEDNILNLEFGFGEDEKDVIKIKDKTYDAKFNSSNSYARYSKNLFNKQLYSKSLSRRKFLYPEKWGETYNTLNGAVPKREDNFDVLDLHEWNDDPDNPFVLSKTTTKKTTNGVYTENVELEIDWTRTDKDDGKIPLREVFISVSLIKRALGSSSTVQEFMQYILDEVNKDSKMFFNWTMGCNSTDTASVAIIDEGFSAPAENNDDDEEIKKIFMFEIFSENSIVNSYDLSCAFPKGNMGNKLMIEAMSPGEHLFPVSKLVDEALSGKIAEEISENGKNLANISSFGVEYMPNIGRYHLNKYKRRQNKDTITTIAMGEEESEIGERSKSIDNYLNTQSGKDATRELKPFEKKVAEDTETTPSEKEEKTEPQIANENLVIANSIDGYFTGNLSIEESKRFSTPLPIKIGLSIYGISGIIPGNLFRVDYLPSIHAESVIFFCTKITHTIGGSWKTDIDAQMRVRPSKKTAGGASFNTEVDVILNRDILKRSPLSLTGAQSLIYFIHNMKPVEFDQEFKYITDVFTFKAAKTGTIDLEKLTKETEQGYAYIAETENSELYTRKPLKVNIDYKLIVQGTYWVITDSTESSANYDFLIAKEEEKEDKK